MPRSVASLAVSVTANTRGFARGMSRARKQTRQFTLDVHSMSGALRQMGAAALLNPITALGAGIAIAGGTFVRAARQAEEFNRAMRNSQAIMGELTDAIDKDMRRAAFDVARYTQFTATEAAKAYFYLASAGLTATQTIKAMPIVSKFAQAGMFDLARATDLVTDAQSALGLTVDDAARNMANMQRVADVLVRANTLANASVEQFSESLTTKAGAALKIVGKDIEEGVAVLAAFADQGVKASDAGTALNIVMRDMQTKALQNAAAFRRAQVAVFDINGEMRNMADIVADIERALAGMSDATKKQTLLTLGFSDKSVIFLQTLIGLSERIREYEAALRSAGGTTAEVAAKQLTSFQRGWAQLKAGFEEFQPVIQEVVSSLGALMELTGRAMTAPRVAYQTLEDWYTFSRFASHAERFFDALSGVAQGSMFDKEYMRETQLVQERLNQMLAERTERTKELAQATEQVAKATRKAAPRPELKAIQEIIGGLSERLAGFGRGPLDRALDQMRALGATANEMRLAIDTVDAIKSSQAAKELDDIIYGLEREQEAITHTARELDLLQAGWKGATEEQLAYINNLHDSIDAQRELAKQEREAKAAAARQTQHTDRITRFVEVDLSRTLVSGLTAARRQKQKVQDEDAIRELRLIRQNTARGAVATVAPG